MMLNSGALNSYAINSEIQQSAIIGSIVAPLNDAQSEISTGYLLDGAIDGVLNEALSGIEVGEVLSSSLDNISFIADATIQTGEVAESAIDGFAHDVSATGSEFGITFASIDNIMQMVDSVAITGEVVTASLENPIQAVTSEHSQTIEIHGTAQMPMADVLATLSQADFAEVIMPMATVSSVAGSNFADISMPMAIALGSGTFGCVGTADIAPKPIVVVSSIASGYIVSADLVSIAMDADAIVDGETLIVANLASPIIEVSATVIGNEILTASMAMPMANITGAVGGEISNIFTTYAMNVENAKVTQYTDFATLAMAKVGNVYLSASPDGIYLMDGDTDNGNVIDARVRFGMDDMGSEYKKRVQYAYVGSKGTVGLRMLTDGDNETNSQDATHQGNGIGTRRIKLGKGTKSRYWQPEIAGNQFEIDSISLDVEVLSRKVA